MKVNTAVRQNPACTCTKHATNASARQTWNMTCHDLTWSDMSVHDIKHLWRKQSPNIKTSHSLAQRIQWHKRNVQQTAEQTCSTVKRSLNGSSCRRRSCTRKHTSAHPAPILPNRHTTHHSAHSINQSSCLHSLCPPFVTLPVRYVRVKFEYHHWLTH